MKPDQDNTPRELLPRVKPLVAAGLAIISSGALALGAWSAFAPLSGAVVAPGYVKVDLNRKVVQHQEGGTVREIRVRDGERVAQGQVLLVLDNVSVKASLDLLSTQLMAEQAKAARLIAEASSRDTLVFPAEVLRRGSDPKVAELIARERALFTSRRDALNSQVAGLRAQAQEATEEARALADQIAAEDRAITLQKQELSVNEELLRSNFVQKTRVMTLQRGVAEYEAKHGEHRAELSRARQRASEIELRILAAKNEYKQGATTELKEVTGRVFDLEEKLRPSRDASQRQQITAPIAGEIVGLKVFTAGAVIGPREVLMEVVPDDKRLIVEARIRPEDINHVRVGAGADLRLTAYQSRTTPLVSGKVNYVSADRLVDQATSAPYYSVHIDVPADALSAAGDLKLQAGMPAEAFIRTDERSLFDYVVAPITAYLRRGLREPI